MEAWLETFAMLALLLGITSADAEWYTTSSIDPIDDTRSAFALRLESPGQWTRAGRHRLLLLSCKEKRPNEKPDIRAAIAWNMSAENFSKPVEANRQGESRTTTGILTRFGDEQAQSWTYERVWKGNELFVTFPHDMARFLEEAKRATEVALRLEHEVKGTQTTVFDLTGSARVIKAMESGCNSPSQPRSPLSARHQEATPTPSSPPPPSAPTQRSSAALSEEGALASLSVDDRAWIESSCSRDFGPAHWSSCVRHEVEAVRRGMPDISGLAAHDQAWIESSCSRDFGPAHWSSCVRHEVGAVRRGMPDISGLAAHDQAWIESSCSRDFGPAHWSSCVRHEVGAVRRGMPDISGLAAHDQAWIESSCSRDFGPAHWSSCVRHEVEAVRGGMPDISDLAAHDQAWIESSCSRDFGPAHWSSCVRHEVEEIRRIQQDAR